MTWAAVCRIGQEEIKKRFAQSLFHHFNMLRWNTILFLLLMMVHPSQADVNLKEVSASDILTAVAEYKGEKAVLVNYWATWCGPCVEEFPMIVHLAEQFADDAIILFVSTDWLDAKQRVIEFLQKQGITGLSLIKNQNDNEFIDSISREWSGALPFTIVYDKNTGNVVDFWEGKQPEKRFFYAIEKAISEGNQR